MAHSTTSAPVVKAVGELLSRLEGPGPFAMHDLDCAAIAAAIRMKQHHLAAIGTYRLTSCLEVVLVPAAPDQWGQRSIEIHTPGPTAVQLASPFADGHWRGPGLEAVLVSEPPDRLGSGKRDAR
jgi:hypothetical protein